MHEFSLAQSVLDIVTEVAQENEIAAVDEVRLDIGQISGVSVEALEFAWSFLRDQQECTKTAALAIKRPEGHGRCRACGFNGRLTDYIRICPACGSLELEIISGEEFMVTGISGE